MNQSSKPVQKKINLWKPRVVCFFLCVLVASMWWTLDKQREENLHELVEDEAELHLALMNADTSARLFAFQRIVDRWVTRGGTPKAEFIPDAKTYIKDLPGLRALEWVDSSFHVRWIVPLKGNEQDLGLAAEAGRRMVLESAREKHAPIMTAPVNLAQGDRGLLIYFPIYIDDRFDGFLLAVTAITPWFDSVFEHAGDDGVFATRVSIENKLAYNQLTVSESSLSDWKATARIQILDHNVQIEVTPTQKFFIANRSNLPELLSAIGVLLTVLITYMVFLFQRYSRAMDNAATANVSLEEKEKHLRAILESTVDGIITINGAGIIQTFNPAAESLFGYTSDEVCGQNINMLMPEPYSSQHDGYLKRYQQTNEARVIGSGRDVSGLCKDGSTFPMHLSVGKFSLAGQPMYSGITRDITESKRNEEKLSQFKTSLDLTHDGVLMFYPDSLNFFYVNRGLIELLGYSEEELRTMTLLDVAPDMHKKHFKKLLQSLVSGADKDHRFRAAYRRSDGSTVPVDIMLQYLAPKSEPPRFVCVIRDITRQKEIEEELRAAKQKAEAGAITKAEFLANMSHEIRTPMNGVLGMLELLQTTEVNERQKSFIDTARSSAKGLLRVINDILDFSKVESGRLYLENVAFDVRKVVENTAVLFARDAEEKNLEINCFVPGDVPRGVSGDPVRLRQVLSSLISNAIKFTQQGEIDISVRLQEEKDGRVCLRFEVMDTGIGLPGGKLEDLYDAFNQADNTSTRKYGGIGLGLSISKQLIELMGGEISVSSTLGEGSKFWFYAYFDRTEELNNQPYERVVAADLRVLAVDDNETNLTIITHYLSNWNIQSDCVDNARAALDMLKQAVNNDEPYQVVLLDYHMPEMDGLELARVIKADDQLAGTHLIILSSLNDSHEEIKQAGIERHLVKPALQSDIYDALLQVTGITKKDTASENGDDAKILSELGSIRILVVDDMNANRLVAVEMLRELGINADVACDGQEAIDMVKARHYDLVLMDCQMPLMDGYEATEVLRAQEKVQANGHLPVIALTAHAMEGDREACLASGMDDYLSKPFSKNELSNMVSRWLPDVQKNIPNGAASQTEHSHDDAHSNISEFEQLKEQFTEDVFRKLVGCFKSDVNTIMPILMSAASRDDIKQLEAAAHGLKGVSSNMTATRLSELSAVLEQQAQEDTVTDARHQAEQIKVECERVLSLLKKPD